MPPKDNNLYTQIIEKAAGLFQQHGYNKTSVQDICDAVGISKGGLFYHFRNKEDILFEIHETFINKELEKTKNILQQQKSCRQLLQEFMEALICSIGEDRSYVSVFFQEKGNLTGENLASIRRKRKLFEKMVEQLICKGIEKGEFRSDINPSLMCKAVFGICNWTLYWIDPNGAFAPSEIGKYYADIILDGIASLT